MSEDENQVDFIISRFLTALLLAGSILFALYYWVWWRNMNPRLRIVMLLGVLVFLLATALVFTLLVYKDTGLPITYVPACDCPEFLTELARQGG